MYFGGWWTWQEDAEQRQDELRRTIGKTHNENLKRQLEDQLSQCGGLLTALGNPQATVNDRIGEYRTAFQIPIDRFPFSTTDDRCNGRTRATIAAVDIRQLGSIPGPEPSSLLAALLQRQQSTAAAHAWIEEATLTSPLVTGIGREHPTENGFAFLDPYGLPYLPGSAVKGILRRGAEELAIFGDENDDHHGWTLPAVWWLFGFDETSAYVNEPRGPAQGQEDRFVAQEGQAWAEEGENHVRHLSDDDRAALVQFIRINLGDEAFSEAFGENPTCEQILEKLRSDRTVRRSIHTRGSLDFWDVLPQTTEGKIRIDILNPHHKSYYEATGGVPGTFENPQPHFFLTLPPGSVLRFIVAPQFLPGCPGSLQGVWQGFLASALGFAGRSLGFGAKTSAGYGRLEARPDGVTATNVEERGSGSRRPGAARRAGAAAAPQPQVWASATLLWQPSGGGRVIAISANPPQARATTSDRELIQTIPDSVKRLWEKRKTVRANVTVRPLGTTFTIIKLEFADHGGER
jgi:CRISPR-associated protein Cmr6